MINGHEILVLGYGNPGRCDDGLGPAFAEAVAAMRVPGVRVEADYQLAVEDAASLGEVQWVIFADAAVSGAEPFIFQEIAGRAGVAPMSHALLPEQLLALARQLFGAAPRAFVLAIRGYRFDEFGEELSDAARNNLRAALEFIRPRLEKRMFDGDLTREADAR